MCDSCSIPHHFHKKDVHAFITHLATRLGAHRMSVKLEDLDSNFKTHLAVINTMTEGDEDGLAKELDTMR